ncbi:MgtC/SapB family protein [Jiella marina]|uniref:MgtC/SapB family protein n=1 Tax=Jiella sp. LLJ827 TaxID=2917712 RepID=UPI002101B0FA|nr:MgtC/SapB family protein [Jiella sp. LLJ827]MCQ0989095.1 MgtC/SapB family protein [Jiella sp. LLJ827]
MSELTSLVDWPELWSDLIRLAAAAVLCGAVGFEREHQEQSAGLRTHMLVGLGACVFTLLMTVLVSLYDADQVRADPIRMIGAITSGVAFLAAGAIIQAKGEVRGLTTGASLWLSGAVGLACGLGEFRIAILAVFVTLIVLRGIKSLERHI